MVNYEYVDLIDRDGNPLSFIASDGYVDVTPECVSRLLESYALNHEEGDLFLRIQKADFLEYLLGLGIQER